MFIVSVWCSLVIFQYVLAYVGIYFHMKVARPPDSVSKTIVSILCLSILDCNVGEQGATSCGNQNPHCTKEQNPQVSVLL